MTLAWIVGSGGMLGSALDRQARGRGADLFDATPVNWSDGSAATTLADDARAFADRAGSRPWVIAWAAGSSVVASESDDTAPELGTLDALLTALLDHRPAGPGVVFVTSSAGGVYAGSSDPPFDEDTAPVPISPYGLLKLRQERLAAERLGGVVPLVIGRFSNLYGPGQNPDKAQGLVAQLCLATVRRKPLNLYVSMDTVRDYLYVDDGAALAWAAIERALVDQPAAPRTIVIGSGQPTTVAEVIATVQGVAHRRVPLAIGTDPNASRQVVDLRVTPSAIGVDELVRTPLPTGVRRVFDAIVGRVN